MLDQFVSAVRTLSRSKSSSDHCPVNSDANRHHEDENTGLMNLHKAKLNLEKKVNEDGIIKLILPDEVFDLEDESRPNNREEIRRKLAMGIDVTSTHDDYYDDDEKPSFQRRLQSGMNLQICFMNDTVAEEDFSEAPAEEVPPPLQNVARTAESSKMKTTEDEVPVHSIERRLNEPEKASDGNQMPGVATASLDNGLMRRVQLQAEARLAMEQAKEMARMQIQVEKQQKKKSAMKPKVGMQFPDGRVGRSALLAMNLTQLQIYVNDMHTQIENLNEELVRLLLERDELLNQQDSMLVDVEDLTRQM